MKIIDISWPISEQMTAYKDRHLVRVVPTKTWEQHAAREHVITLGTHTGTHVDAPAHFLEHGHTIDAYDWSGLIGPALVVDFSLLRESISVADLQNCDLLADCQNKIVLFKTRNSQCASTDTFDSAFVALSGSGAQWLVQHKVRAVGIDYLGIERGQSDYATHRTLLGARLPIIEGLRLSHVQQGMYQFVCLPLSMPGLDAAPARAILMVT